MKTISQSFDYFGKYEAPEIMLCNPNKQVIGMLSRVIYDVKLKIVYNGLSELSFTIPKSIDGGETDLDVYDLVKSKRLVYLKDNGYFIIESVEEDDNGDIPVSTVECSSLEASLNYRRIVGYEGTVKFYESGDEDLDSPQTVLGKALSLAPNWSVGTISTALTTKYRTFETTDTTLYAFLINDVSTAYGCVFEFDTINNTISASLISEVLASSGTDIYVSHNNLVKSAKFSEYSDEVCTALSCYGGGDLDIRYVNPIGSNTIYDFSYYKNNGWMSDALVTALGAWESTLESYSDPDLTPYPWTYPELVEDLLNYYLQLAEWETALANREGDYASQEQILKGGIEADDPLKSTYNNILKMLNDRTGVNESAILSAIQSIFNEDPSFLPWLDGDFLTWKNDDWLVYGDLTEIRAEIRSLENTWIPLTQANMEIMNYDLAFDTFFSPTLLEELQPFIIENTWQNENIIVTDLFTTAEIIQASQELYDQGVIVLEKVSQPRYEFTMDTANIVALPEFSQFANELELGKSVTVEAHDTHVYPILLAVEISFDNLDDFTLTFSNKIRLNDGKYQYADLFGETVKTGKAVSFNKLKWQTFDTNYKNDVSDFIYSALDASRNSIINSANQEITINGAGLRGRQYDPVTDTYDDEEIWITGKLLAFTKDSWNTSSLALGKLANGAYGLVGETIVGNIIAGNELNITNDSGSFVVDGDRATFTDISLNVTRSDGTSRLIIDPSQNEIFKIQKKVDVSWVDVLYADVQGNIELKGKITATSGSIGGLTIDSQGLSYTSGGVLNYIRPGSIKLGGLTISGNTATFSGTIHADHFDGTIDWSNVTNVPAYKVNPGTLTGMNMAGYSGNRVYWPGVDIASYDVGILRMEFNAGTLLTMSNNSAFIYMSQGVIQLKTTELYIGSDKGLTVTARIYVSGVGYKTFEFTKGILTGYYS